jgi:hypothetical protein
MQARATSALSVCALVVAVLGWTPLGEAARDAVFPPNSVGTLQLRDNAVVSAKIRNGSVTGLDVQKATLTGAHVKPGTLLASNFRAGQLPAGPKGDRGEKGQKGDKGDKGSQGDPGLSGVVVVQSPPTALAANGSALVRVTCPAGKRAIGGGGAPGIGRGRRRLHHLDDPDRHQPVAGRLQEPDRHRCVGVGLRGLRRGRHLTAREAGQRVSAPRP